MSDQSWYKQTVSSFITEDSETIVQQLNSCAIGLGFHVYPEQEEEWKASVNILKDALPLVDDIEWVILEYNFKRRGLRIDCLLMAPGVLILVEFKRSILTGADVDQVKNYCINLREFHEKTQQCCERNELIIVPVLALTSDEQYASSNRCDEFHSGHWGSILKQPIRCNKNDFADALKSAIDLRTGQEPVRVIDMEEWSRSIFAPSSTILDAAVSLYGQHDVSAITDHAIPIKLINQCTDEIKGIIKDKFANQERHIIFVSGTPGSGKTLVGLNLAFDKELMDDSVFVTGNAPLVDVLEAALKRSYKRGRGLSIPTGFLHKDVKNLIEISSFKLVKAHHYLAHPGESINSTDGRVLIFDEAQRTYSKGKKVNRVKLLEHEADLFLKSLEESFDGKGCVVVALIGTNQYINAKERNAVAWLEAAEQRGWTYSICDQTLSVANLLGWKDKDNRENMEAGHLTKSIRFYKNEKIEEWTSAVLNSDSELANTLSEELKNHGTTIFITRDLDLAKSNTRSNRVGEERAGLIASGCAWRLRADGLDVRKEASLDIKHWMLAPTDDLRSSNMLETVQNVYNIQGLELDHTIVCWDADLRREGDEWRPYHIKGSKWTSPKEVWLDILKNIYRVLLTRARKNMIIYVPKGDLEGIDDTRRPEFYDGIYDFLCGCGATEDDK